MKLDGKLLDIKKCEDCGYCKCLPGCVSGPTDYICLKDKGDIEDPEKMRKNCPLQECEVVNGNDALFQKFDEKMGRYITEDRVDKVIVIKKKV